MRAARVVLRRIVDRGDLAAGLGDRRHPQGVDPEGIAVARQDPRLLPNVLGKEDHRMSYNFV